MKVVAYQGVEGSFSYMTAVKELGIKNHFASAKTFVDMFQLLTKGIADYAVLPIENSLIGSIYENYDLLNQYDGHIVAERYTKIEHCLLGAPVKGGSKASRKQKIRRVFSHPKALEQCSIYLADHPSMEAVVHMDTAGAAADIAKWKNPEWGAIAGKEAALRYGLDILEERIEDDPKNYTRFVIIAKVEEISLKANKCSVMFHLKHVPGALCKALKHFADRDFNLTKIESRPIRGKPFTYVFYVDFEFPHNRREEVEQALVELKQEAKKVRVLGFYKGGRLWTR